MRSEVLSGVCMYIVGEGIREVGLGSLPFKRQAALGVGVGELTD